MISKGQPLLPEKYMSKKINQEYQMKKKNGLITLKSNSE